MRTRHGAPGLRGVEHIGFTVPDLDQATRFFVDVIGCELVYVIGPFQSDDELDGRPSQRGSPGGDARAALLLRCANGPNFEIFQYESPDQHPVQPRNSDIGGHHLGFYVEDLDAAIDHLRAHGVRILGEPTSSSGPSKGQRWVYFLTPWGMTLELVCFPQGKAYEARRPGAAVAT